VYFSDKSLLPGTFFNQCPKTHLLNPSLISSAISLVCFDCFVFPLAWAICEFVGLWFGLQSLRIKLSLNARNQGGQLSFSYFCCQLLWIAVSSTSLAQSIVDDKVRKLKSISFVYRIPECRIEPLFEDCKQTFP